MTIAEFEAAVAAATGDTVGTIRRCGFSMLTREPFELEPDDVRPPLVIDWETADPYLLARFIDELTD